MAQILIVDDSEPIRRMLAHVLQGAGHLVKMATDGENALRLFREHKFDLVVTDINMPDLGGIAMAREIRAINEAMPIVAVTTELNVQETNAVHNAGFSGWLRKPFRPAELVRTVNTLLDG